MAGGSCNPGKGGDHEWTAKQLVVDLDNLGYKRIVIRCDSEHALVALAERVKALSNIQITIETSPVADKNANGHGGRAVQAVECHTRTLKLELEERLQGEIPVSHSVMAWLVRHAADVVSKCELKASGMTAYQAIKGRPYRGL